MSVQLQELFLTLHLAGFCPWIRSLHTQGYKSLGSRTCSIIWNNATYRMLQKAPNSRSAVLSGLCATLYTWRKVKRKSNLHPINSPWMSRGEIELWLYSFFNIGARRGGWSTPRSQLLYPWKETRYQLYRVFKRRQGRSLRVRKISPPPGFDPRTVPMYMTTDYFTGRVKKMWTFISIKHLSLEILVFQASGGHRQRFL